MTIFGEGLVENLSENSSLRNPNNPMFKVLDGTIGEWLTSFDDLELWNQFFLTDATGKYLDLHGSQYDIKRKLDEDDDHYRTRIVLGGLGYLTIPYLLSSFDLGVYTGVSDFSLDDNTLVSDNPFINTGNVLVECTSDVKQILESKFVLGGSVDWLIR